MLRQGLLLLLVVSVALSALPYESPVLKRLLETKDGETLNARWSPTSNCPYHPPLVSALPSPLPPILENALAKMEAGIKANLEATKVTGGHFLIHYRGQLLWQMSYGLSNLSDPSSAPTNQTIFRIGSITKAFTSKIAWNLAQKGKWSLLDPLAKHLPGFAVQNPFNSNPITLEMIMAQRSGLPREAPCNYTIFCEAEQSAILEDLSLMSLILPPWKKPSYSNLGFALLGHAEEALASSSFADILEEEILQPMQLTRTGYRVSEAIYQHMAVGYLSGQPVGLYSLGWNGPCGEMWSTTADLMAFIEQCTQPLTAFANVNYLNPSGSTLFGSPWETFFLDNYVVLSKAGDVPGYAASIASAPDLGLTFAYASNSGSDNLGLTTLVYESLIPALQSYLSSIVTPITPPPSFVPFVGNYTIPGTEVVVKMFEHEGHLQVNGAALDYLGQSVNDSDVYTFQLLFPPVTGQSCLISELLATDYAYFQCTVQNGRCIGCGDPGNMIYLRRLPDN